MLAFLSMFSRRLKTFGAKFLPWGITVVALYYAFHGVDWKVITTHVSQADLVWLLLAVVLTVLSYLLRSLRWRSLFPEHSISYVDSARVLFLGFFMNNILPARAGEFVRAHMGARLTGLKRTLVLATIASERLIDGLTISFFFIAFAVGLGDSTISRELLGVAILFGVTGLMVIAMLALRGHIFALVEKFHLKIKHTATHYAFDRVQVFLNGLSPLLNVKRLPFIVFWSLVVWSVELAVYWAISEAFSAHLSVAYCVLFLVAVNFSSLIPAAPGGIGVIEAITSAVLISIGIEKEHALSMVIAQHVIQYLVVGIPGAVILFNWKRIIEQNQKLEDEQPEPNIARS